MLFPKITLHQMFWHKRIMKLIYLFFSIILDYQLAFKIEGQEYNWLGKKVRILNSPCTNESQ